MKRLGLRLSALCGLICVLSLAATGALARQAEPEFVQTKSPVGEWVGHYLCPQGITGLTLTVQQADDAAVSDEVVALFSFYPLPDNPTQSGLFTMIGNWDANGDTMALSPDVWISQPEGWVMVGLEMEIAKDYGHMTGHIPSSGCGPVYLARSKTDLAL